MKKKLMILMLAVLLLSGCGNNKEKDNARTTSSTTITSIITTTEESELEGVTTEPIQENTSSTTTSIKTTLTTIKQSSSKTTTTKLITKNTTTTKKINRNIIGCWEVENYTDDDDFAGFVIGTSNVKSRFPGYFDPSNSFEFRVDDMYYQGGNWANGMFYSYEILSSSNDTIKIKITGVNRYNKTTGAIDCPNTHIKHEYTYTWKDDNTIINKSDGKVLKRVSCSKFLPNGYHSPEC